MKNSTINKKKLEKALVKVGSILLKHYNPCELGVNVCKAGTCQCCWLTDFYNGMCPFLEEGEKTNTCTNENIKCQTGFCPRAIEEMDEDCFNSLKALEEIGLIHGIIKRPPYLKDQR